MFFYSFYVHTKFPIIVTNFIVHYIIGLAVMLLSYCNTCRVGTAGVHLGGESPMPEYSVGWLETKRGSNVICKHMHTLSLKTVRCEVVFTHLVCPTPTCSHGHEEASWHSSALATTLHTISDFLSTLSEK